MDFKTQISNLILAGSINKTERTEATRYLKSLLDTAQGDERFLGLGEANSYLNAINKRLDKIRKLQKGMQEQTLTKDLSRLDTRAKRMWVGLSLR